MPRPLSLGGQRVPHTGPLYARPTGRGAGFNSQCLEPIWVAASRRKTRWLFAGKATNKPAYLPYEAASLPWAEQSALLASDPTHSRCD